MEPIVLCALGFVVYSSYLTAKEIAVDLRRDGWVLPLFIKHFLVLLLRVPIRICPRGVPRTRIGSISFIYLRCRAVLPRTGQSVAGKLLPHTPLRPGMKAVLMHRLDAMYRKEDERLLVRQALQIVRR